MIVIDTCALSAWADGTASGALDIIGRSPRRIIPAIVLGEYRFGIAGSRYRERYEQWLEETLPECEVHPITEGTARIYARLRRQLKVTGSTVAPNDLWIAACAIELGMPLLSRDTDFDRIKELIRVHFDASFA